MTASVVVAVALAVMLSACAGSGQVSSGESTGPTGTTDTTISLGVDGAWSVVSRPADRLVRDAKGAYLCVLRRPDDLADLRAQFHKAKDELSS